MSAEAIELEDIDVDDIQFEDAEPASAPTSDAWNAARRGFDDTWRNLETWRDETEESLRALREREEAYKLQVAALTERLQDAERRLAEVEALKSTMRKILG